MLTSSASQYYHPDYLQPLPTTLDAKKSPLALLAQTCSSIGKDPSPCRAIIPPLDKKDKESSNKSEQKRPSSQLSKSSNGECGRDSKPGFRTIPSKELSPSVAPCEEMARDSNSRGPRNCDNVSRSCLSTTTSPLSYSSSAHLLNGNNQRPVSAKDYHSHRPTPQSGGVREGRDFSSHTPPGSVITSTSQTTRQSASVSPPRAKSSSSSSSALPAHSSHSVLSKPSVNHPSLLPGVPPHHPLAAAYHPLSLLPGLDPMLQSYHNALAVHSGLSPLSSAAAQSSAVAALKGMGGSVGAGTALSPYIAYARVRTPSGATTLVPVCRDPYCANCQLTLQNSHLSSACTAPGCSQCAHEKSLTSLTSAALSGGLGMSSVPVIPAISSASTMSGSMAGLPSLHGLYPLAAHQGLGYVCSWVAGSEYCGKRFAKSEELLQHLRTHTSSTDHASLAAYGTLGLHPGLAAAATASAAGCPSHYPGSPISPSSLRRTYPSSLSPVSSMLSANRYHPYKSSLGTIPPAHSAQGLSTVGPSYYSPYSLYGQRLGAAAVP